MKLHNIFFVIALLLMISCATYKQAMVSTSEDIMEAAIYNAILDFSRSNNRLYKADSVFFLNFKDSVYEEGILIKLDERTWGTKRGHVIENLVRVGISACPEDKLLVAANTTPENYKYKLPTRCIVIEGKLFYWFDDRYPLTQETLDLLAQYNLLQDDEGGLVIFPDYVLDDSQKGADYYFCRYNLKKYKRRITNKGYLPPPKVKCDSKQEK